MVVEVVLELSLAGVVLAEFKLVMGLLLAFAERGAA